jgi:cell division protein ZapD
MSANTITYEQPINELTRVLLRLEHLFDRFKHFSDVSSSWDVRAALNALFDTLDVLDRNDFRGKLNKEINRQILFLESLRETPQINLTRLNSIVSELTQLKNDNHESNGRFGQALRDNVFLNSIRQHYSCAGGTCPFNTPGFYLWLQSDAPKQSRQLQAWFSEFQPLERLTRMLLQLIRESAVATPQQAENGFFQMSLEQQTPCQLVRIIVPVSAQVFPRISAGRHGVSVRFLAADLVDAAVQTEKDVSFKLSCCVI